MNTPASRRYLHSVPTLPTDTGAPSFRVRFSAATGFTALLQPSPNTLGWFGNGTLHFDEKGLEVRAPRRVLIGLRTRQHFHLSEVRDVYREDNAVQLEVRRGERHERLCFWAQSSTAAAAIVELLPAHRTIEFDAPLRGHAEPRARRRSWWPPVLGALAALALLWFDVSRWLGAGRPPTPALNLHAETADKTALAAMPGDEADVATALTELHTLDTRFRALDAQFSTAFLALQLGNLSQKQFIDGLNQWLLPQWEALAAELRDGSSPPGPARARARELLGATIDSARRALFLYARGLHEQDFRQVEIAFNYLHDAETHEAEARRLREELEQARSAASR